MSQTICENPQLQSPLNRASKDKFVMILNLPPVLRKRAAMDPLLDIESLQLSVYGTIVPEITVFETDVRFAGQNLHISSYARPTYPPLTINFVVDNNYQNYYVLWKWLEIVNDPTTSLYSGSNPNTPQIQLEAGNSTEYQTDFSVVALNEYNQSIIEFFYKKAFITTLGSINYNYRDGEILECSAQFHFSQLNINRRITNNLLDSE
jgi:hypothetical protein